MTDLQIKLAKLPSAAGIYYHLDAEGRVIYVGKAANLRVRVRHYFQPAAAARADERSRLLRQRIADVRWTTTDNPLQALFLESEMIKRYQPRYNFLERNVLGESWLYVLIRLKGSNPGLLITREPATAGEGEILGPYLDGRALRKALRYLRRSFPYSTHKTLPRSACLDHHLGLCPGPETAAFEAGFAKANLRHLSACLKGRQGALLVRLRHEMAARSDAADFEAAARLRDQITALKNFSQSIVFKDLDRLPALSQDRALNDLRRLFGLARPPERIEAYDISHISGSHTAASMVVAIGGLLMPAEGRRFKAAAGNDDFGQIRAVMRRRFTSRSLAAARPQLILIDGGRGQVSSVQRVLDELRLEIPVIGLAKKREEIVFDSRRRKVEQAELERLGGSLVEGANFTLLQLDAKTALVQFLQRLRDASHRSALSYHNHLQAKASTASPLLGLPGFGPKTYAKLMRRFGSLAGLRRAPAPELDGLLNAAQRRVLAVYLKELRQ